MLLRWISDLTPEPGEPRRLAVISLLQAFGAGMFGPTSVIFLAKVVGLSATQIGLGLSVAGAAGFLASFPMGHLADRLGVTRVMGWSYGLLALSFVAYAMTGGVLVFVVLACAITVLEGALGFLRGALIHRCFTGGQRVKVRAQLRSVFNLGVAAGSMAGTVALAIGLNRTVFAVLMLSAAAMQAVCASLVVKVPLMDLSPSAKTQAPKAALRDRRFVLVALANAGLELSQVVLMVGIPIWILRESTAPPLMNAVILTINTVVVLLFQVALSKGSDTLAGCVRLQRNAGISLALSCVALALSAVTHQVLAIAALVAGAILLTVGELLQAAGGWGISHELTPSSRAGEYQSVFGAARALPAFVGPALVTFLLTEGRFAGWALLALLFVALGLVHRPIVARES